MILKLGATFFARPALHFSNGVHTPEGVSEAAGAVWHEIHDTYAMGISDIETLDLAVRALDRARLASTEVEADGPVVLDRFGQRKSHPGVEIVTTQNKLYDLLIASLDLRNRPTLGHGSLHSIPRSLVGRAHLFPLECVLATVPVFAHNTGIESHAAVSSGFAQAKMEGKTMLPSIILAFLTGRLAGGQPDLVEPLTSYVATTVPDHRQRSVAYSRHQTTAGEAPSAGRLRGKPFPASVSLALVGFALVVVYKHIAARSNENRSSVNRPATNSAPLTSKSKQHG